ncbi:MAG: serine--tRNA ligase [Flavobacteriales bacterium]|nr:serine--tRNA ligase [Flavobacteriales bacterium]
MLPLPYLRHHTEEAKARMARRNPLLCNLIDNILEADDRRRASQSHFDALKAQLNQISSQIGQLLKTGRSEEAEALRREVNLLKEQVREAESALKLAEQNLNELLTTTPNLPHPLVKAGRGSEDNELITSWGHIPEDDSDRLPHWELASQFGLIDFESGVKITGSGFPVYVNQGARLQRALINFFLDEAVKAGYTEYQPPHLVNADSGFGTGQLPDKDGQMYHVTADNLYLIPTAEVPLTNLYRDVILREEDLPIKLTAYTPCYRREAGSYGKDVRGLNRLHQFDKVEIVQITHPDRSYEALEEMLAHVSSLLQKLGLPYRIMRLCGGDMGFAAAMTYDFETYSAAQKRWLEVSSTSNFETFQAIRMKLRFKDRSGKTQVPHTLNGSALALPRIVASLLELYQQKDCILLPKVLHPYFGSEKITIT